MAFVLSVAWKTVFLQLAARGSRVSCSRYAFASNAPSTIRARAFHQPMRLGLRLVEVLRALAKTAILELYQAGDVGLVLGRERSSLHLYHQ